MANTSHQLMQQVQQDADGLPNDRPSSSFPRCVPTAREKPLALQHSLTAPTDLQERKSELNTPSSHLNPKSLGRWNRTLMLTDFFFLTHHSYYISMLRIDIKEKKKRTQTNYPPTFPTSATFPMPLPPSCLGDYSAPEKRGVCKTPVTAPVFSCW